MGFQDALWELGIGYASEAAVAFADSSMEADLLLRDPGLDRAGRGARRRIPRSPARSGTAACCRSTRCRCSPRSAASQSTSTWASTLDWEPVRAAVRAHGMRNSNTMAIAPTATIANIQGVSQSIEPLYTNLYVKSNLSGEFTVVNERLVRDLAARGLWDAEMLDDLKYDDGSVQAHRAHPRRDQGALPDRLRDRRHLADRLRRPPPEVDRHGAVAQSLRRRAVRPRAERSLPLRLAAGSQDDLLPPLSRRDAEREIDARRQPPRHPAALDARPQRLGRRCHRAR